ncbi:MAG: peptidylprolyl isomerase [Fimbriimonadaceae bacterium]
MKRLVLFFVASILALTLCVGVTWGQGARGETLLRVEVENRGDVWIKLHTKEAPRTTSRIIELAEQGFYNGQRFFLVAKTPRPFLIRAGDPLSKDPSQLDSDKMGTGGTGQKIPFEDSGFSNRTGAVGLATLANDKNSGDSQFYILLGDHPFLDGSYTVFGQVVQGMDVVNKVEKGDRIIRITVVRR